MRHAVIALVALAVSGCPGHGPPPRVATHRGGPAVVPCTVAWGRVAPEGPPEAGTWRIHMIDVGTGLAILVQGADFTLLYDAGSGDPREKPARVIEYLARAIGRSGDADLCGGDGAARTIDHVVLSHPHLDHGSALDLVLHCYDVDDIWDSGRINQAVFYRDFLAAVGRESGATYHTAGEIPERRTVAVKGIDVTIPDAVAWRSFGEGDVVELGDDARFTLLHAEAKAHPDPNENSVVMAIEMCGVRLLLTGDAESGERADPSAPLGGVEQHLVERHAGAIDADILQVGHHGSKTSSRRAFLDAVSPTLALVSAGPKSYRGTRLPDPEVLAALEAVGAVILRTDEHDHDCPDGPGGCDSWVVTIRR